MRALAASGSLADRVSTAAETVTFWISAGMGPMKVDPGDMNQLAHLLKSDLRLATRDDGCHRLTSRRPTNLSTLACYLIGDAKPRKQHGR